MLANSDCTQGIDVSILLPLLKSYLSNSKCNLGVVKIIKNCGYVGISTLMKGPLPTFNHYVRNKKRTH